VTTKDRDTKLVAAAAVTKKRDQKIQDKRDAMTKTLKKKRYQQAQAKTNRAK